MEKVTVESGVEQRWGDKDEMTVTGTHHRQVGEALWEVHCRDEVRHGGKNDR